MSKTLHGFSEGPQQDRAPAAHNADLPSLVPYSNSLVLPTITSQRRCLHLVLLEFASGGLHMEIRENPPCILGVFTASVTGLPGALPALALKLKHSVWPLSTRQTRMAGHLSIGWKIRTDHALFDSPSLQKWGSRTILMV